MSAEFQRRYAVQDTIPESPDCQVDKHRACDGRALDVWTDEIVECQCFCHKDQP